MKRVYIAGPMRGLPLYNFPAFDAAAARFRADGFEVLNPAEMDRERGFNESNDVPSEAFLKDAIMRDLDAVATCSAIALLPGWTKSQGVAVELAFARFIGIDILDARTGLPMNPGEVQYVQTF